MSPFERTIIITGGTSGLGYHCAAHLAKQKPEYQIIVASRSNANKAADAINDSLGRTNVEYLPLDLSSLENIRAFATEYREKHYPPIAALLLNAALQFPYDIEYTKDGIEATFGITHVGHALLFYLLRPELAEDARIILTSSGTHDPAQVRRFGMPDAEYISGAELAHPSADSIKKNSGRQRYGSSKLCNVLWTYALHRRLVAAAPRVKWTVVAMDPGLMPGTDIVRGTPAVTKFLWYSVLPYMIPVLRFLIPNCHSAEESGANLAGLAVSEEVEGVSGVYYEGMEQIDSSEDSMVEEKQEELWAWTLNFVAKDEEEKARFERF